MGMSSFQITVAMPSGLPLKLARPSTGQLVNVRGGGKFEGSISQTQAVTMVWFGKYELSRCGIIDLDQLADAAARPFSHRW
jgi:hypothetical protein